MIEQKKEPSVSDLKRLFDESKTASGDHLAKQRVNNNLYIGNHYKKKTQKLTRALEDAGANEDVKIRITKNHTKTVCKYIMNSIVGMAPTGVITPKNPGEIQDQKSAEIHKVIFDDWKTRNKLKKHVRRWVLDYVVSGEIFVNQFWDPNKGPKMTPNPIYDPITQQTHQQAPFPEGDVEVERIFPWDVRMDPGAKDFESAMWVGYEKMVDPDVIKRTFSANPDVDQACAADQDDTYKVFEASTGSYKEAKNKVLLRQIYYRPCTTYPSGKYIFFTKEILLAQGDLPADQNGNVFFPIKYLGFDEIPTSPRSESIIEDFKPEQMEVNRCASAIAQTQMTVGFDKLLVPVGGEVSAGTHKSGIRIIRVPGGKVSSDYIQGRSGDQFLTTLQQNIAEIYQKTGVPEKWDEKNQDVDIMASLYKNMRQKMRFSMYGEKFSEFLTDVIEDTLRLKKAYMSDASFFRVTGKSEYQNIAEFRSLDDLGYQVKVEEGTEDLESRFGRYMSTMQSMQYVGANLDQNTIGLMLKNLPFSNNEEIHSRMTINYENAKNIMLSLDRGEYPEISQIEDPLYISSELNHRMRKPDFKFLNDQIKQAYLQQVQAYNQIQVEKLQQVQMAEQGFIPFDGPQVPVDGMYEETTGANGQIKTTRVQVAQSAINWLLEKKKQQGSVMGNITDQPLGMQADLASQMMQQQSMPGMSPGMQMA